MTETLQDESTVADRRADAPAPRWARVMGTTGRVLIGAGVVLALFAAYQVWGTGIQESRAQSSLRDDFESRLVQADDRLADLVTTPATDSPATDADTADEDAPSSTTPFSDSGPADASEDSGPDARPADEVTRGARHIDFEVLSLLFPEHGDAVARIEIPAIDVDKVVVRGIQVADLRKGPGLYPSTVLPGNIGNTAIAGHRTTYGAPFGQINELEPGDEIFVTTIQGRFRYRVSEARAAFGTRADEISEFASGHVIVEPTDIWVLDDFGDNRLTLTACHPKFSARERIIVAAELVSEPVGLPEAIAELVEEVRQSEIPGEVFVPPFVPPTVPSEDGDEPEAEAIDTPVSFDLSAVVGSADLDEGLAGERGAIPAAVGWLAVAWAVWLTGVWAARRQAGWKRRLFPYMLAALPTAAALWMCFEAADRALPAY